MLQVQTVEVVLQLNLCMTVSLCIPFNRAGILYVDYTSVGEY